MVKDFDDSEYLSKLQTKLLEAIRSQIPKEHFNWWFDEKLSIEDISEDNRITFGADSELSAAWLQLRYSDMLKKTLRSITNENVDFELSFVVREAIADIIVEKKDTAFDFLFEDKNNEYNEEYKEHIEEKCFEELFEMAFGKKELERQRELLQKRLLKPDYAEGEINLIECPICGCEDVENVEIERELESNNRRIKSLKIRGGRCSNSNCSEEFYNMDDMDAIRKIEKLLNELFPN
ncbi:DnaA N-terminal domain-containing protein [Paenibacillus sediminis]|uniref:House-cleaning noncanonical NTP pyrophosphatase (MazG superfamily) n=1 Tax=Paenibacillus sediminis TaxID=664909 RepID=A0ABS4H616_9BACL|nr:DnaA N-terminal domain-containing protein [Paenibacillus sediminis]MBP1937984.1 putative house-cleaning noncanonical NTP pyrophosphatase (MazG superfamily) [Paenibacillus sediminis]